MDEDILTHIPHVVGGVLAAGEGLLAGVTVQVLKAFEVLGTVVGLHVEAFDGMPDEFLVVVGTFEVFDNHFLPFLGRNGREFAE